jgi:hypothetical protein
MDIIAILLGILVYGAIGVVLGLLSSRLLFRWIEKNRRSLLGKLLIVIGGALAILVTFLALLLPRLQMDAGTGNHDLTDFIFNHAYLFLISGFASITAGVRLLVSKELKATSGEHSNTNQTNGQGDSRPSVLPWLVLPAIYIVYQLYSLIKALAWGVEWLGNHSDSVGSNLTSNVALYHVVSCTVFFLFLVYVAYSLCTRKKSGPLALIMFVVITRVIHWTAISLLFGRPTEIGTGTIIDTICVVVFTALFFSRPAKSVFTK